MTWPFENDTSAAARRVANARIGQNRFRNRLAGAVIFMAAAVMAFVSAYAYNVLHEYDRYIRDNNTSKETAFAVLAVGLVLISVCSLVVYNIFYISVINDVTSFGQLRTIGATKKQVKQILSREGGYLALRYIPAGCIAGVTLSFLAGRSAFLPLADIMIGFLSGIVVFICVKLSVLKPAKIAMSISPVEAFRYNGYSVETGNSAGTKNRKKSRKHLTPFSLAVLNLSRNRKKSILTFTSLALSGMMFVGASSLLSSLDPEERAKQAFPYGGCYVVELNRGLVTPAFSLTRLQQNNLLTEELKNQILSMDGAEEIICQQEICAGIDGMETAIYSMNAEDFKQLKGRVIAGGLPECGYTGKNSLVINLGSPELEYLRGDYGVGDAVAFSKAGDDAEKSFTYTVAAIVFDRNSAAGFILPAGEMERMVPYNANSAFVIRAKADGSAGLERELYSLVSKNAALRLKTLKNMTMQYKSVFRTISIAVYALLAVIFLFSIINLVNTSLTNILSRRKELGILRAVGLGGRQLCHMIGFENAFQTVGSFAASLILGLGIGKAICSAVGKLPGFGFVTYAFPVLPVLLYAFLAFALEFSLTKWLKNVLRPQAKNSVKIGDGAFHSNR